MRRFGSRLALTVLAVALVLSLSNKIAFADDGTTSPTAIVDPVTGALPSEFPDDPERP